MGAESCDFSKHWLVVPRRSSLTIAAGNEIEMKSEMRLVGVFLIRLVSGSAQTGVVLWRGEN